MIDKNWCRTADRWSKVRAVLTALSALIACRGTFAADAPLYGPPPPWVRPVPGPEALPTDDAPVKLLLSDQQLRLTEAGEESYTDTVVRLQTSQGLQTLGTLQLLWQPATDTLTIHKVQLLRDGKVIDLLAGDTRFTVLRREHNLEYSALDGMLTAALQPEDLRVGDILEMAVTLRRSDPVLAGTSEAAAGGWVEVPVGRAHMRASWPASYPVKWAATDDIKPVERQAADETEITFQSDAMEPPAQPAGAPARFAVTRRVEFSSFKSWQEVSSRLAPLFVHAARIPSNSPLQQELKKIRALSRDPAVRAAAALKLVESDVRYVYLGMNQAALVPADADTTWNRRFGDCKAKSVLLLGLLQELGIEAEVVAVSSTAGDLVSGLLPSVGAFDHVLVRAHVAGHDYWLDATRVEDRGLETLRVPDYKWGLPLTAKGSALVPINAVPLEQPSNETSVTIDASSGISAPAPFKVVTVERGDTAVADKNRMAALTGASLDRSLREYWAKKYPSVDVSEVGAKYDPVEGTETVSMSGSAHMEWKDHWYATDGLGAGYMADFKRPKGTDLTAPYAVAFPFYARVNETIILPKGWHFTTTGADIDKTVAGFEIHRKVQIDPNQNVFHGELSERAVSKEFPAAEADSAQVALRSMFRDGVYLRSPDGETPKPMTASGYINQGNALLNRGKYDDAVVDFDKALALDPGADMALADRGMAYLWLKRPALANKDWDTAEALNPRNPVVWRGRGAVAAQEEDYARALAAFDRSLETEPGNTFCLTQRARAHEKMGHAAEAIVDATAVIDTNPSATIYAFRAHLFRASGRVDMAAADLDSGRKLAGASAPQLNNFCWELAVYGEGLEEALAACDAALELAPTVPTFLDSRALVLLRMGRAREAITDYDKALLGRPDSPTSLFGRGLAREQAGDTAGADADIAAARTLDAGVTKRFERMGLAWNRN